MSATLPFTHVPVPGSRSPISRAVGVPTGATTWYLSGQMPAVIDPDAPPDSRAAYGDTYRQTLSTLNRLDGILAGMDLAMRDVVHVHASLVADPELGKMDFDGFNAAWAEFFAGQDSAWPARMVLQIAGLVHPAWLLELEVIAAK